MTPNIQKIKRITTTYTTPHPLGVKPSGNALLSSMVNNIDSLNTRQLTKELQLGYFAILPDELILTIIELLNDPKDLRNLGYCSRVFFAFTWSDENWRKLYMRSQLPPSSTTIDHIQNKSDHLHITPLLIKKWQGTWRRSVLHISSEHEFLPHLPSNLLCSDALYRPYQCSQINYKGFLIKDVEELGKEGDSIIKRVEESEMTKENFQYWYNKPFILTNRKTSSSENHTTNNKHITTSNLKLHVNENEKVFKRWPSWTIDSLKARFPTTKFRQESVDWPLELYSSYLENNHDESPLYLFDCGSQAHKELAKEYEVPEVFKQDLFTTLSNNQENEYEIGNDFDISCRPNHRWIIIGPERSGSTFHKDPNSTSAWNAAIQGRKFWIMFPPSQKPPGVSTDESESEVTSPLSIAEWVLAGFYDEVKDIIKDQNHPSYSNSTHYEEKCLIGICEVGETVYVPAGWWHSVINLDDSIAITENFIPVQNLGLVLDFLKSKSNQISGFSGIKVGDSIKKLIENYSPVTNGTGKEMIDKMKIMLNSWIEKSIVCTDDCGEEEESQIIQAIYPLFYTLLLESKYFFLLPDALKVVESLEYQRALILKEKRLEVGELHRSKMWAQVVDIAEEEEKLGFQFQFDFDEDESDDNIS